MSARTAIKCALPFAAVLGLGVASAAFDPRLADAAPARCAAEVLIHEDNSYSGLALYQDGTKVAHAWTVVPRSQQDKIVLVRTSLGLLRVAQTDWQGGGPVFRGQACTVVPVRS